MPSEAEVAAETAIPSSRFPSDHVSVVFELEWLPKGDTVPLTDDMVPVGVCAMGQGELIGVQTGRGLTVLCDPNSEEGVQKMR